MDELDLVGNLALGFFLVFVTCWSIDTCRIFGSYLLSPRSGKLAPDPLPTEGGAVTILAGNSGTSGSGGNVTLTAGSGTSSAWHSTADDADWTVRDALNEMGFTTTAPLTIKMKEFLLAPDWAARIEEAQSDVDGNGYWGRQMYLYDIYGSNYLNHTTDGFMFTTEGTNGQTQA